MIPKKEYPSNWRDYQKRLQRQYRRDAFLRRLPSLIFYTGCSILILFFVCLAGVWISAYRSQAGIPPEDAKKQFVEFRENSAERSLLKDLDLDPTDITDNFTLKRSEYGLSWNWGIKLRLILQMFILVIVL